VMRPDMIDGHARSERIVARGHPERECLTTASGFMGKPLGQGGVLVCELRVGQRQSRGTQGNIRGGDGFACRFDRFRPLRIRSGTLFGLEHCPFSRQELGFCTLQRAFSFQFSRLANPLGKVGRRFAAVTNPVGFDPGL